MTLPHAGLQSDRKYLARRYVTHTSKVSSHDGSRVFFIVFVVWVWLSSMDRTANGSGRLRRYRFAIAFAPCTVGHVKPVYRAQWFIEYSPVTRILVSISMVYWQMIVVIRLQAQVVLLGEDILNSYTYKCGVSNAMP